MAQEFSNNASSTVDADITLGDTTIILPPGEGNLFPPINGGDPNQFAVGTIQNVFGTLEIIQITGRSGDILTVVRGYEATTAAAWVVGDRLELRVTAGTVDRMISRNDAGEVFDDINMGDNKITDLDNGVAATDAVNLSQLEAVSGSFADLEDSLARMTTGFASSFGATNAWSVGFTNSFTALTKGSRCTVKAHQASTGNVTLNVDGLGSRPVYRDAGVNLLVNDVITGLMMDLIFEAGNYWTLLNPVTQNQATRDAVFGEIYPVNSLYYTHTNINPSGWLPGAWSKVGTGRTFVGVGGATVGGDSRTYPEGNDAWGRYLVRQTEAQLAPHTHTYETYIAFRGSSSGSSQDGAKTGTTGSTGSGAPMENAMPAYGIYCWRRTS
jgi:hypothetical protein